MDIPPADLTSIREHYSQGRYRQALAVADRFGPLRGWTSTPARLLGGRLAMQLGAPRLGRRLHAIAFRAAPANLEAIYYHARYRFERFGPLSCWRFMQDHRDWADASPELRADWLSLSGFVAARLNDFDRAEKWLDQAEALAPRRAWIQVERAAVYESADRLTEALAAARRSLVLQAWFRPGVQAVAHILQKAGQEQEAAAFLRESCEHLESGIVAAHLATLQLEQERHAEARMSLQRYEEFSPLMEAEGRKWLEARRCDVAYALNEWEAARQHALQVDDEFYQTFAKRLQQQSTLQPRPTRHRVIVPATTTPTPQAPTIEDRLSQIWGQPFPPPDADAVPPLDGIPDAAERRRVEAAGWLCREFTLTEEVATELLQAGLPFLLTLVEVGVSQPRLVVSYDPVRNSVMMYDGHERKPVEAPMRVLLDRYRTSGPRCLVAVPGEQRPRLAPFVDLPDADGYDKLFAVQSLYHQQKSQDAKLAYDGFVKEYVGHRLAKVAAIAWARMTAHPVLLLDAANAFLAAFPNDPTFTLTQAAALRELGRSVERRAVLKVAVELPNPDPLLIQSYAQMLLADHRHQYEAERWLRKSVRVRPMAAAGYFLLASQKWDHQQFTEAAELYRFASCLDDREEQFADAYFRVAVAMEQAPEALRLFQRRAIKNAKPQLATVKALYTALLDRDEPVQAFAALTRAIEKLSPATPPFGAYGDLMLFRAEQHAHHGRWAEAAADQEAVRSDSLSWHKAAVRIARLRPDPATTLRHLHIILARDPHWIDGHRQVVSMLIESQGLAEAQQYVSALANRLPYSYPLVRLRAELLSPVTEEGTAIRAVQSVLDLCPHDAWARRQLALVLADRKRDSEALEQIRRAAELEPTHPSYFAVLAHVHRRAERIDDALGTYRAGLRINVDHELAISELVRLSRGSNERRAATRFVVQQLHSQPHTGDGLCTYRDQLLTLAAEDEEDHVEILDELHDELERFLDERPDLWQCWSLMIQHYGLMQRLEEASALAEQATVRFPLLAQLWADLARVHGALDRSEDRVDALRQAVAAAPTWPPAAQELAEALADAGEDEEAIAVLERATARSPHDTGTQAALAELLWNAGNAEQAVERAERAVRLDPGFDAAWRMVLHWSDRLDRPGQVIELARELTHQRPGDARGWLKLARLLHDPAQNDEALAALETVIRLDPKNIEAHDQKAERLADMGRFDEAILAASPRELADDPPLVLKGRAAWVEAKRGNYPMAIPPMQRLVTVEPEYFWGWQQLAEWYNETDRAENFLEAASELVRLKPDHPMPLTLRGEAKLKTGDRAGGKADLRDALRLAPQYAPAAAILFDACMIDSETRDARAALAVLQEHAGGQEVLVKQVQLACREGDAESALRTLADLAATPNQGSPMAMQIVLSEIQVSGWTERATKVLYDAFHSDEPFCPWAPLFWLDLPEGELASFDERIAAVDAVIAGHPTFAAGHDRKAELLVAVGRFDDAITVCRSPVVGDPSPITLRGRVAWIEARRGNRGQAITLMKQVVSEDPEYLWGWRNLAQWYDAEGRQKECLEAAEQMVRLTPDDPIAFGYRGEARRTLGDRIGAKADFARAFELDPRFDAAGLHLVTEQLEAGDVDAAARTLSRVQEHADGSMVKLRAAQVAAKQNDLALARQRFRAVAADSDLPVGLLRDAANALDRQGWAHEVDEELSTLVQSEQATRAAAAVWADRLIQQNRGWLVLETLPKLMENHPTAGREATVSYAQAMALSGRGEQAATTIHRFADPLRSDVESWARAGIALADGKQYALAATWLADWQSRDGIEPWMLRPLADSLRAQDRDPEADAVARVAATMIGASATLADFRGWLALTAAVEGRWTEATDWLTTIDRVGLTDGIRLVVAIAEAVVMVGRAGAEGKATAFAEAREHLKVAADACKITEIPQGLGRWYKRAAHRMGQDAGRLSAKIWAWWQQTRPMVK